MRDVAGAGIHNIGVGRIKKSRKDFARHNKQ